MAVTYCNGGATGGIERVVDHSGTVWWDCRASTVAAYTKKSGWSALPQISNRWGTIVEATPYVHYKGCIDRGKSTH